MYLVVGLGNPGKKFEHTPHNTGFRVLAGLKKGEWEKSVSGNYLFLSQKLAKKDVFLVKPLTFMNKSGRAVKQAMEDLNAKPDRLLLVHDDFDLKRGGIKISKGRGAARHKGVASVIEKLGTNRFPRVRVGVGNKNKNLPLKKFVLKKMKGKKRKALKKGERKAEKAVKKILSQGVEKAMTVFNQ